MKNKKLKVVIIEGKTGVTFKAEGSKRDAVYYMLKSIYAILNYNKESLHELVSAFIHGENLKDLEKE